ncbi:pentatricopeptide repeat-containing protein [Cocos nucifera]|nr:pentatricopeptide repeat-containing protein [Cocos nucifera]
MGFALVAKAAAAEAATVPLPLVASRQHPFQLHLRLLPSNNSSVATPTAATSSRTTTTSRWRRTQSPTQPSAQALPPLLQRPQKLSITNKQQPHPPISTTPETNPRAPDTGSISTDGEDAEEGVVPETCTATDVLHLMDGLQLPIEADLYLSLVRECTHSRDAFQGAQVHAHIQRSRPRLLRRAAGLPLANRLLLMYATCGQPDNARQMFDQMAFRDPMSWAAILAALAHHGGHREALQLFADMRESAVEPGGRYSDALVLVTTLRSCVRARELGLARQVHGLALKVLGESGAIGCGGIGSSLLQCYSMLGCHQSARRVFERIRIRSRGAAVWTCVITGCCREGRFEEALYVFREMGRAGHRRNSHVVSSILAACARIRDGGWGGRQVHASAVKLGVDADRYVGSSLVDMYAKHGLFKDARWAFETIAGSGDPVCWNAMLAGYARGGCCSEAISLLYRMRAAGVRPKGLLVNQVRMACST